MKPSVVNTDGWQKDAYREKEKKDSSFTYATHPYATADSLLFPRMRVDLLLFIISLYLSIYASKSEKITDIYRYGGGKLCQ